MIGWPRLPPDGRDVDDVTKLILHHSCANIRYKTILLNIALSYIPRSRIFRCIEAIIHSSEKQNWSRVKTDIEMKLKNILCARISRISTLYLQ